MVRIESIQYFSISIRDKEIHIKYTNGIFYDGNMILQLKPDGSINLVAIEEGISINAPEKHVQEFLKVPKLCLQESGLHGI